jgi:hypothetical protein
MDTKVSYRTYLFGQLQVQRANVVAVTNVFCLSIEALLTRLHVSMVARLAVT